MARKHVNPRPGKARRKWWADRKAGIVSAENAAMDAKHGRARVINTTRTPIDFARYDRATLVRWWFDLQRYVWPEDFPSPQPPWLEPGTYDERTDGPEAQRAIAAIEAIVPREAMQAAWDGISNN